MRGHGVTNVDAPARRDLPAFRVADEATAKREAPLGPPGAKDSRLHPTEGP
ncbi:MAG: hypothetical protein M3Z20_13350 [Chloroflexota bacterium]|nr:hypothetical protein [Chloroflexota bacterium]